MKLTHIHAHAENNSQCNQKSTDNNKNNDINNYYTYVLKRVCVCVCACLFANLMCSFICCSWSDRITRVAKGCSDPTNGITIAELYKYTHKYRVKYICARQACSATTETFARVQRSATEQFGWRNGKCARQICKQQNKKRI